jgi:hypothetical protein
MKKSSSDDFQYYQSITSEGLKDIRQKKSDKKDKQKADVKKLYHYCGPVTIYDRVVSNRLDKYIHANTVNQALYLLQQQYVKDNPRLSYVQRAWLDRKYIEEVKEFDD